MRCCWAFWRALIKGVAAKLVADVTARSSEARIIVLITILLCVAVADVTTLCRHLTSEHAQDARHAARMNVRAVTKSYGITKGLMAMKMNGMTELQAARAARRDA